MHPNVPGAFYIYTHHNNNNKNRIVTAVLDMCIMHKV